MSEDDATHVPEWWNEGSIEIEFQEANPKQPGSKAFERYNQYREARTVADAIKQGASREDLQNDRKKGFLKMTGKTPRRQDSTQEPFAAAGDGRHGGRRRGEA